MFILSSLSSPPSLLWCYLFSESCPLRVHTKLSTRRVNQSYKNYLRWIIKAFMIKQLCSCWISTGAIGILLPGWMQKLTFCFDLTHLDFLVNQVWLLKCFSFNSSMPNCGLFNWEDVYLSTIVDIHKNITSAKGIAILLLYASSL